MPRLAKHALSLILVAVFSALLPGCLTDSYRIPDEELERLVELPPAERGANVRVVQRLVFDEDVDQGAPSRPSSHGHTHVSVGHVHTIHTSHGHHTRVASSVNSGRAAGPVRAPVNGRGGTVSAPVPGTVTAPAPAGNTVTAPTVGAAAPSPGTVTAPTSAGGSAAPTVGSNGGPTGVGSTDTVQGPPANTGGAAADSASSGGRSSGGSSSGGLDLGGDKELIALVIVAAAAVTVALVATEGARFDGWVRLTNDQPIHLIHYDGRQEIVALADLTPQDIGGAEAVITEGEASIHLLDRAPLDRQGFTWRMGGAGLQVTTPDGGTPIAPAAVIELGYFPLQSLGLLFTSAFGWGSQAGGEFVSIHYGLAAEVVPFALGRFHLGGYGATTMGYLAAEGGDLPTSVFRDPAVHAGLVAELDITTRLGLQGRVGAMWQHREGAFLSPTLVTSLGLSIY